MQKDIKIGVFGGSGFYKFCDNVEKVEVETPYGKPSSAIFVAEIEGKQVAFLPRHGVSHEHPPHKINYRANVWAMQNLGVKFLLAPCACGSLQLDVKPGDFVFCDQFLNATSNRENTFFDGPDVAHISCAEPYCLQLRNLGFKAASDLQLPCHKAGTVVTINGPHFASCSESADYTRRGFRVINMTQYPEVVLAREAEMCYASIALITDYDSGLKQVVAKTNAADIMTAFQQNLVHLKSLLFNMIKEIDINAPCACHKALTGARMT
jgi:5'-methylthioadenosine phosphorylase